MKPITYSDNDLVPEGIATQVQAVRDEFRFTELFIGSVLELFGLKKQEKV